MFSSISHSWQTLTLEYRIFIIEGILTVVVGVAARFWVCDWPETAKFLTEEERLLLTTRLQTDSGEAIMNRLDKAASTSHFLSLLPQSLFRGHMTADKILIQPAVSSQTGRSTAVWSCTWV